MAKAPLLLITITSGAEPTTAAVSPLSGPSRCSTIGPRPEHCGRRSNPACAACRGTPQCAPDPPDRSPDSLLATRRRAAFYRLAAAQRERPYGGASEYGYEFPPSDIGCHLTSPIVDTPAQQSDGITFPR